MLEAGSDESLASLSLKDGGGELAAVLEKAQSEMKSALSDSFDTPRAMRVIAEVIKEGSIHINTKKADADIKGLENLARWITKMVGIFGLDADATAPYDGLGWTRSVSTDGLNVKAVALIYQAIKTEVERMSLRSPLLDQVLAADVDAEFASRESTGNKDPEFLVYPYIRAISKVRDELRKLAPTSQAKKEILSFSDRIRDDDLTNIGVYLDDRGEGQSALPKFIPASELLAQKEEKASKEREKVAAKEKARLDREKAELEKAEKAKLSPHDMFRDERFSAWDEEGLPTKTKEGDDVPKSALKKMKKDWERQKKAHEEWKAKNA